MRRLADAHEHLDGELADPAALDGNLRDLARINRILGGTSLSVEAVRHLIAATRDGSPARILDVGTGAADIPLALLGQRDLAGAIEVTGVDSRVEILDAARRIRPSIAGEPRLTLGVADGRRLPYPDGAFDIAHASLVLHHLEPAAAIELLRELRRVSTFGVVINDLQRGRLPWIGGWLLLHLMTRNPYTLHDGPLSVRRAYTRPEARELLARAGLYPTHEAFGPFGHRWAIAAVPEP